MCIDIWWVEVQHMLIYDGVRPSQWKNGEVVKRHILI